MRSNRWPWVITLTCLLAWSSAPSRALAQSAPERGEEVGQAPDDDPQFGDPDAAADGFAWLDGGDRPGGGALEAPHGRGMGTGGGHMGLGRGRMGAGMALRNIDLSKEQRDRIRDIRDKQMRSAIRAQADMRIAQLDLAKLMRAANPDRRAIDSQIERLGGMRTAMQKSRVGTMFEIRNVLTPEQRDQLREDREQGPRKRSRTMSG